MAPVAVAVERRRAARVPLAGTCWQRDAVLRPGLLVWLVNAAPHGLLLESPGCLRPGRRVEVQLCSVSEEKVMVAGRVVRCQVTGLEPLRFHGAIELEEGLALGATTGINYP